jgi:hypothetical protein
MKKAPQSPSNQSPSELPRKKEVTTDELPKKLVLFDDITVYEFAMGIGNNPACREGCPVMLGAHCLGWYKVDINTYEEERGLGRHGKELHIPVPERAAM